ncbi:hypothetical protein CYMTET_2555 [Cymbomonas tetramitiformis]|uniref:Uncharacterized protein n=1 Tax=Cymbomonas tetramitiformis TaxID=36881 RepID=A0AAE0LM00_9CHLO|nr:hypothetical protein CYMTET_2555 [Cymbomonas tetramitiformis]
MVDTAHLFTANATNATELSTTSSMHSERADRMIDRMASITNATSAVTEAAHMAGGELAANLMNATTDFLQRQAGNIDIREVNALMHALSNNETIAHAFDVADGMQERIDNITEAGVNVLRHIASGVLRSFESTDEETQSTPMHRRMLAESAVPQTESRLSDETTETERLVARIRGMDSVDEMGMRRMMREHHGQRSFLQRCEECVRMYSHTPDRFRELTWDRRRDLGMEPASEEQQMKLDMAGTRSRLPTIDIKSSKLIQFCYRTAVALSHDDTIREAGAFIDDDILRLCDYQQDATRDDDVEAVDDDVFVDMVRSQIRTCVRLFVEDDNLTRGITKADSSLYHRQWSMKKAMSSSSSSREREDTNAHQSGDDDGNDDDVATRGIASDEEGEDGIETPRLRGHAMPPFHTVIPIRDILHACW